MRWAAIPGYPGYQVSDEGVVYSLKTGRPVYHHALPHGHVTVSLWTGGKGATHYVHRLVAEAFCERRPGNVVRHLDGNPANNNWTNLAWGTLRENTEDSRRHGTMRTGERHYSRLHPERVLRGEQAPGAVLTEAQVRSIRQRLEMGEMGVTLAIEFGVSKMTISDIKNRRRWKEVA